MHRSVMRQRARTDARQRVHGTARGAAKRQRSVGLLRRRPCRGLRLVAIRVVKGGLLHHHLRACIICVHVEFGLLLLENHGIVLRRGHGHGRRPAKLGLPRVGA